jgi:hypothetical protein
MMTMGDDEERVLTPAARDGVCGGDDRGDTKG